MHSAIHRAAQRASSWIFSLVIALPLLAATEAPPDVKKLSLADATERASTLYDQGAYARAVQLLDAALTDPGAAKPEEIQRATKLRDRVKDAAVQQYEGAQAAAERARADAARRDADAARRKADLDRMLAQADEFVAAGQAGDVDKLAEAARLRSKVASERAIDAYNRAMDLFEQGEYDKARRTFELLQQWTEKQKAADPQFRATIGPERERLVGEYLAKADEAKASYALGASLQKEVAARREEMAKAAREQEQKRQAALAAYDQGVMAFNKGQYAEALDLFKKAQGSGVALGGKRDAELTSYVARIQQRQSETAARRAAAATNLNTGEELLKKNDWRAAREFLNKALRDEDLLAAADRARLATGLAQVDAENKKDLAQASAAQQAAARDADAQKRSEAYLKRVREQYDVLQQQEATIAQEYINYAREDVKNLKYDSALKNVNEALAHQPTNPEALKIRDEVLALQGNVPAMRQIYPGNIKAEIFARIDEVRTEMDLSINRGRIALSEGRAAFANKAYDEALRRDEESLNQFAKAQQDIDWLRTYYDVAAVENQLRGMARQARDAQIEAARALEQQRVFKSLEDAERAAREERAAKERQRIALFSEANAEYARGKFKSAISLCERILETSPDDIAARDLMDKAREQIRARTWAAIYQTDKRARENQRLIDRATLIWPSAVVQYPAKEVWNEIVSRQGVELPSAKSVKSPGELDLEAKLDREMAGVALPGVSLQEAIEIIKTQVGKDTNFLVDPKVFTNADILITLDLKNVTLRTLLNAMLRPKNLNFIVSSGAIYISDMDGTRLEEARPENLSFRQYDIHDLLISLDSSGGSGGTTTGTGTTTTSSSTTSGSTGTTSGTTSGTGTGTNSGATDVLGLIYMFTGPLNWDAVGVLGNTDQNNNNNNNNNNQNFGGSTTGQQGGANLLSGASSTGGLLGGATGANGQPSPFAGQGAGRIMFLRSGYLMVNHVDRIHKKIEEILAELRAQTTIQVQVEARLIKYTDDFFKEIGVDWSGITFSTGRVGPSSGPRLPAAQWAFDFTPASNVSPALSTGIMNLQASFLGHGEARAVIHAVKNSRYATDVSSPHVTVLNTQLQTLTLTQQGTYVSGYQVQDGIAIPTLANYTVSDITLDVRPVVSADRRYVTMYVHPQINTGTLLPQDIIIPVRGAGSGTGGSGIGIAVTISTTLEQQQTIESTVRVPDRGTLVLGGLATAQENTGQGSVPILAHIPVIKRLFVRSAVDKRRTHLLFLVTPTIMLTNEIEP